MSTLSQFFPPKPKFTEKDVGNLAGKVYIVTGANTGVGKELARMLYSKNAKVYMLARSADKTNQAIADIQKAVPVSKGSMISLKLDLADLSSIKQTVERFLGAETKLHVLFNNAGVMSQGKELVTTPQGYEQHVGINVLGGFLLARLLTPVLARTAQAEPPNTVRIIWVGSGASEMFAVKGIGATPEMMANETLAKKSGNERYWDSKVGNWAHAAEYARRHKADGIVSVCLNPGNLRSDLYRDQGLLIAIAKKVMMYPPAMGAYTEFFAGLSSEVTVDTTLAGDWVIPFGRIAPFKRGEMKLAVKPESEGGTGGTFKFWNWTEDKVRPYM